MFNLVDWVKHNKLAAVLAAILLFLFLGRSPFNFLNNLSVSRSTAYLSNTGGYAPMADTAMEMSAPSSAALKSIGSSIGSFGKEAAPQAQISERMVVSTSYLSLVVKDVREKLKTFQDYATSISGYMIDSNLTRPEEGGTGTLVLRIPSKSLESALEYFRSNSIKVVSENLKGSDVTDQYVNNEERLRILERNKARFEEIMQSAVKIEEILQVQREIFNLQSQIDSIKGQQEYLAKTAEMAKITLYLSTDEMALPYAPVSAFRPELVLKQAVRHLIGSLQGLASILIWVLVYAVIWIPALIIILIIRKRRHSSNL